MLYRRLAATDHETCRRALLSFLVSSTKTIIIDNRYITMTTATFRLVEVVAALRVKLIFAE